MKTKWMAVGLLLIVILAALLAWKYTDIEAPPPVVVIDLTCPTPAAGCTAQVGDLAVSVGLAGELKPLQPFQVWVKAAGVDEVHGSFTMAGMNMGFNRYTLSPDKAGVFRAQVTLPACVSGRRDWMMSLDIDNEFRVNMPFATELP